MRITTLIIFLLLCFWFGNAVSMKYAWTEVEWKQGDRYAMLVEKRPYFQTVLALNNNDNINRNTVIFQSGFYEYRAWCDFKLVGRRNWVKSWSGYRDEYPQNTAHNLNEWLVEMGADYLWIKPGDEFEVPYWSGDFEEHFREAVVQQAWTGEISIMYEVIRDEP